MCVWLTSAEQTVPAPTLTKVSAVSPKSNTYTLNKESLLGLINSARSNSALDYSLRAARETNQFNAAQAEINRNFQQTSAEREMAFNAAQAALNRQFQQASADKSMEFEREMSNTTYQRAVADLKASGLSPLLAYNNLQTTAASGASASGSAASGASASGSAASGVKAEAASALSVESKMLGEYLELLSLSINSGLRLAELEQSLKVAKTSGIAGVLSSAANSVSGITSSFIRSGGKK